LVKEIVFRWKICFILLVRNACVFVIHELPSFYPSDSPKKKKKNILLQIVQRPVYNKQFHEHKYNQLLLNYHYLVMPTNDVLSSCLLITDEFLLFLQKNLVSGLTEQRELMFLASVAETGIEESSPWPMAGWLNGWLVGGWTKTN
jgi:hypothetical protein